MICTHHVCRILLLLNNTTQLQYSLQPVANGNTTLMQLLLLGDGITRGGSNFERNMYLVISCIHIYNFGIRFGDTLCFSKIQSAGIAMHVCILLNGLLSISFFLFMPYCIASKNRLCTILLYISTLKL